VVPMIAALAATTPTPAPTTTSTQECYEEPDGFCRFVYDLTHNASLARVADWVVAKPLAILLIILIALLARFLVRRSVDRVVRRITDGHSPAVLLPKGRARSLVESASPLATVRRRQRSEAMGSVLKSIASFVIAVVSTLMILSELGLDVAPALASAGIAGVALGFGAQNLVKDFLAGIFMIFEDQFGVGDVVNMGDLTVGTVETVGLRITRIRDVSGVVWYVRNGEVTRVGNESQGWARVVLDVAINPREDINAVRALLRQTAGSLREDSDWKDLVVEEPEVWGVESVSPDAVVIRVVVKTKPSERPNVARELRERIKASFDANGIEMPFPQNSVWVRPEDPRASKPATGADSTEV
jgi:small-conductance mechanosensitive channel